MVSTVPVLRKWYEYVFLGRADVRVPALERRKLRCTGHVCTLLPHSLLLLRILCPLMLCRLEASASLPSSALLAHPERGRLLAETILAYVHLDQSCCLLSRAWQGADRVGTEKEPEWGCWGGLQWVSADPQVGSI